MAVRKKGGQHMSRIILGTGKCAEIPFFFEKTYVNLYSLEELCYCFVENAELIDQEIVNEKLARWLDEQCGLPTLAHALYALINQRGSASAYVGMILEYAGLYPKELIAHVETVIRNSAGLNPYERLKTKADYMLQNNRYMLALNRYDELLSGLPSGERELRGKVLHNRGVANAKLFLFERAQEDFLSAYEMNGSTESLKLFLTARRMQDKESDYLAFLAEHPEWHDISLKVERMVEQAAGAYEMTDENRMLFTLRVCKEDGGGTVGNAAPYYEEIEKLTNTLKDEYRECMKT